MRPIAGEGVERNPYEDQNQLPTRAQRSTLLDKHAYRSG